MIAVDLLRARGVFRHVIKRGARRGTPYLARAKSAEWKTTTAHRLTMHLPSLYQLSNRGGYNKESEATPPAGSKSSDGFPIKYAVDEKNVVLSDEYQVNAVKNLVLIMASGVVTSIVVGGQTCRVANKCVDAGRCVRTS
eukprot:4141752-Prymnesium_polylepis.1